MASIFRNQGRFNWQTTISDSYKKRQWFKDMHNRIGILEESTPALAETLLHNNDKKQPRGDEINQFGEEKDSESGLFVGNLDNSKSNVELQVSVFNHFQQFGSVSSVRVSKDTCNRPYALVHFNQPGITDFILNQIDSSNKVVNQSGTQPGSILNGRHLRIEKSRSNCTLYISHIPPNMSESQVYNMLLHSGPLIAFNMLTPVYTDLIYGIALASYSSRSAALSASAHLKQATHWSLSIKQEMFPPREDEFATRSIYIAKLNYSLVTPALLRTRFQPYGSIDQLSLNIYPFQKIATATIKFTTDQACFYAVQQEHDSPWLGTIIRVEIKKPSQ